MWLIITSISLAVFATAVLLVMTLGTGTSKRVKLRLAALATEFAPTLDEEPAPDIRREQHKMSGIPVLNHWLTKLNLGPASGMFLSQAGVTVSLGTLIIVSLAGSAIAAVAFLWYLGPTPLALLLAAGLLPLPFFFIRAKRARRLMALEEQLPEALGMMVSALRVGHSLMASLGAVSQDSPELIRSEMRKCFEEQNFGIDLRSALTNLTVRVPVQDIRIFVAAVLIQKESGGNLAEVLEKVAATTRERFRLKKQVLVHTAQGRLTGYILSLLPVFLGIAMYFVNPEAMSVLWTRPIGLKILYVSAAMDLVGALIIRKIVNIRV